MEKIRFLAALFFFSSGLAHSQYPILERAEGDSIRVKLGGRGVSEFEISFYDKKIFLTMLEINEEISDEIIYSDDTTTSSEGLFIQVDTIIKNDSLHNNLRKRIYFWLANDNVTETDSASEFTELRSVSLCLNVWSSDLRIKKKLMERCFYRILGSYEYDWHPKFREFYWDLYDLHKVFNESR